MDNSNSLVKTEKNNEIRTPVFGHIKFSFHIDRPDSRCFDSLKAACALFLFESFHSLPISHKFFEVSTSEFYQHVLSRPNFHIPKNCQYQNYLDVSGTFSFATQLPLIPLRCLPFTTSVYRVFHLGDEKTIGSRISHKGEITISGYHEGNYNYVFDSSNTILEYPHHKIKCKKITKKLEEYGYSQTLFNFQNLLSSLDFVVKTSLSSKKNSNGKISSWFENDNKSFVDPIPSAPPLRIFHKGKSTDVKMKKNLK